jgi:hypothetical protein
MIRDIFIVITIIILVPTVAYFITKYATFGYYSGKHMWENPPENNKNNNGKGVS